MEKIYNKLIAEVDFILKHVDPCKINLGICVGQLKEPCCPRACPFLSDSGCTTQNIGCKIFLCNDAIINLKKYPELFQRWVELSGIIGKLHIKEKKYCSKEEVISSFNESNLLKLQLQYDILNNILN